MKNLRKTFFGSVVSLLICFTMLLGTTFAWFTDSVSSTGNKIMSGTLDVDVLHLVNGAYVSLSENANHKVFNYDLWEPGYTQVETLKIENKGNLALRYQMTVFAENGTEKLGTNGANLADKIEVYMCFGESTAASAADLADTTKWWSLGTLNQYLDGTVFTSGKMLPAGATYNGTQLGQDGVMIGECVASIALHMSEDAGNEYQNLSLGEVYINLVATQWTFEKDSFNDQYDVNAWDELLCNHTNKSTAITYNKTATGHTAVTTEKCDDCHTVIGRTTGTEEVHVDANPVDNLCDVCRYDLTPAHTHVYTARMNSDATHHWGVCSCGDEDTANKVAHTDADNDGDHNCDTCNAPNVTTCADSPVVDGKCDECGADVAHACADENPKNHKCDICGTALSTCEDNDNNHLCDTCNEETSTCTYAVTPNNDGATHTVTVCSVCNKGNNVGTDCEDADGDNKCDVCNGDVTSAPTPCNHVDANHDSKCDNCGETGLAVSHDYTYGYNHDETHHWGVCTCNDEDTNNKVAHDFTNGYCVCGLCPINFYNFNKAEWGGATIDSNHVITYPNAYEPFGWQADAANGIAGANSVTITFAGATGSEIPVELKTKYSDGSEGLVNCEAHSSSVTINLVPNKTLTELKLKVLENTGSLSLAEISVDFRTPDEVKSWDSDVACGDGTIVLDQSDLSTAVDALQTEGAVLHVVADKIAYWFRIGLQNANEGWGWNSAYVKTNRTELKEDGSVVAYDYSVLAADLLEAAATAGENNFPIDPTNANLLLNLDTGLTVSRIYITVPGNN